MVSNTQNRKIAISALLIFVLSFITMMFLLRGGAGGVENLKADILSLHHGEEAPHVGTDSPDVDDNLDVVYAGLEQKYDQPLVITGPDGKIVYAGETFCQFVTDKCEEVKGKIIFDFINTQDLHSFIAAHAKLLSEKEDMEVFGTFRFSRSDGETLVLLSAYKVVNDGNVENIIFMVRDLSEQVDGLIQSQESEEKEKLNLEIPSASNLKVYKKVQQVVGFTI